MKLWKLFEDGLNALAQCEADPQYQIWMQDWHKPWPSDDICNVCLAGARWAKTLDTDPRLNGHTIHGSLSAEEQGYASALNQLNLGNVAMALMFMQNEELEGGGLPSWQDMNAAGKVKVKARGLQAKYSVCPYKVSDYIWKEDMHKILDKLREADL